MYGFATAWAPNLFYNKFGDVVYFAAGVGVVYDDNTNKQRYFMRHDDDIECLAMHPDKETVATGQFGVEPTVWIWSSGDVGRKGWTKEEDDILRRLIHERGEPTIWDVILKDFTIATASTAKKRGYKRSVQDCRERHANPRPLKLTLPKGERSVIACGFSSYHPKFEAGQLLATVSTDFQHTVRVWEWKTGEMLEGMKSNAYAGDPPAVFGLQWNPYLDSAQYPDAHPSEFCTFGRKHLSFWNMGVGELEKTGSSFDACEIQDVLHVCYLPTGQIVAAGPNGKLTVYALIDTGTAAIMEVQAHAVSASQLKIPEHVGRGGARCVQLKPANDGEEEDSGMVLLSGGGDSKVKSWDVIVGVGGSNTLELVPSKRPDGEAEEWPLGQDRIALNSETRSVAKPTRTTVVRKLCVLCREGLLYTTFIPVRCPICTTCTLQLGLPAESLRVAAAVGAILGAECLSAAVRIQRRSSECHRFMLVLCEYVPKL